jgi:hypothetical protein
MNTKFLFEDLKLRIRMGNIVISKRIVLKSRFDNYDLSVLPCFELIEGRSKLKQGVVNKTNAPQK